MFINGIDAIKDMYDGVTTSVRIVGGETNTFLIAIGLFSIILLGIFRMRSPGECYLGLILF